MGNPQKGLTNVVQNIAIYYYQIKFPLFVLILPENLLNKRIPVKIIKSMSGNV